MKRWCEEIFWILLTMKNRRLRSIEAGVGMEEWQASRNEEGEGGGGLSPGESWFVRISPILCCKKYRIFKKRNCRHWNLYWKTTDGYGPSFRKLRIALIWNRMGWGPALVPVCGRKRGGRNSTRNLKLSKPATAVGAPAHHDQTLPWGLPRRLTLLHLINLG